MRRLTSLIILIMLCTFQVKAQMSLHAEMAMGQAVQAQMHCDMHDAEGPMMMAETADSSFCDQLCDLASQHLSPLRSIDLDIIPVHENLHPTESPQKPRIRLESFERPPLSA